MSDTGSEILLLLKAAINVQALKKNLHVIKDNKLQVLIVSCQIWVVDKTGTAVIINTASAEDQKIFLRLIT